MKINETGQLQRWKPSLKIRYKALILRIRNWDAERWYRKYGGM